MSEPKSGCWSEIRSKKKRGGGGGEKKKNEKGSFTKKFHLLQAAEAETAAFEISGHGWPWPDLTPNPERQLQNQASELGLQGESVKAWGSWLQPSASVIPWDICLWAALSRPSICLSPLFNSLWKTLPWFWLNNARNDPFKAFNEMLLIAQRLQDFWPVKVWKKGKEACDWLLTNIRSSLGQTPQPKGQPAIFLSLH